MRKHFIACLFFVFTANSAITAQQVFKTTSKSVIGYLEYLPSDYHTNSNKYPIVIFLHGIGERGADSTDPAVLEASISSVTNLGPPKHAKNGTPFPFILISPQLKKSYSTWPSSYVMEVLNHVKTYLRVDERRIHVTGLSLGGGGAWVAVQDYPKVFATVSPVCGGYNSTSKACGIAAENLPVWAFHGDKDTIVPLSRSVNMVNAINNCVPAPSPLAKMSIYAGVAHDAWERAYAPNHNYHNPNVYDWIMSYTNTLTAGNGIPVANAGSDKSVALGTSSVTFSGTATDKESAIASYQWTKMSGPGATLSGTTAPTLTASALATGTYLFKLTVKDNAGNMDSDYVKLTVSSNVPPVANAGADRVITLPSNSLTIQGTGTDANGSVVTWAWTKLAGGNATLTGQTTSSLNVSGLVSGTYTFRLTITDNQGASHSDDVKVTVNNPPDVFAGKDFSITKPGNAIYITGTATDTDGTIVYHQWKMLMGVKATLGGTSTATLSLTNLEAGQYIFRYTVKDNHGATRFDDILITVLSSTTTSASTANSSPVANAGADKVITLPTNYISIAGSGTDSDGSISSYTWSKLSGGTAILVNATTSTLSLSGLVAGKYTFRLTVRDNDGATHSDDVIVTVNIPPDVYVGRDQSIILPKNSVTVTGTSSDPDGTIVYYNWKMLRGTAALLSGVNTATLSATGLVAGEYIFRFTIKDNHGCIRFDDVVITVMPGSTSASTAVNDVYDQPFERSADEYNLARNRDFWSDKKVVIFDASGKEMFSGTWNPENYDGALDEGMYIVNVFSFGKRVHQEKFYKTR